MSLDERKVILKKNTNFNLIVVSGFSILTLGIIIGLVFQKEVLSQYFFIGLFIFLFVISIVGQLFVYQIPKKK